MAITAWPTSEFFYEILNLLNNRFINKNKKILVLVDNLWIHKVESESYVDLFFYPLYCYNRAFD